MIVFSIVLACTDSNYPTAKSGMSARAKKYGIIIFYGQFDKQNMLIREIIPKWPNNSG